MPAPNDGSGVAAAERSGRTGAPNARSDPQCRRAGGDALITTPADGSAGSHRERGTGVRRGRPPARWPPPCFAPRLVGALEGQTDLRTGPPARQQGTPQEPLARYRAEDAAQRGLRTRQKYALTRAFFKSERRESNPRSQLGKHFTGTPDGSEDVQTPRSAGRETFQDGLGRPGMRGGCGAGNPDVAGSMEAERTHSGSLLRV